MWYMLVARIHDTREPIVRHKCIRKFIGYLFSEEFNVLEKNNESNEVLCSQANRFMEFKHHFSTKTF